MNLEDHTDKEIGRCVANLDMLSAICGNTAIRRGQYECDDYGKFGRNSIVDGIMHLQSEMEEFREAFQKGYPKSGVEDYTSSDVPDRERYEAMCKDTVGAELADVVINALSLMYAMGMHAGKEITEKMKYNMMRTD